MENDQISAEEAEHNEILSSLLSELDKKNDRRFSIFITNYDLKKVKEDVALLIKADCKRFGSKTGSAKQVSRLSGSRRGVELESEIIFYTLCFDQKRRMYLDDIVKICRMPTQQGMIFLYWNKPHETLFAFGSHFIDRFLERELKEKMHRMIALDSAMQKVLREGFHVAQHEKRIKLFSGHGMAAGIGCGLYGADFEDCDSLEELKDIDKINFFFLKTFIPNEMLNQTQIKELEEAQNYPATKVLPLYSGKVSRDELKYIVLR